MKLQIEGQQLRVRVNEGELAVLLAGQVVESRTCLGQGVEWGATLRLTQHAEATFDGSAAAWQIGLPHADVCGLAARLPARDGLHFDLEVDAQAPALRLLFDVDVRDSVKHRGGRRAAGPVAGADAG